MGFSFRYFVICTLEKVLKALIYAVVVDVAVFYEVLVVLFKRKVI